MSELFEVPEVKSPRRKWVERYRIQFRETPNWTIGQEDEEGDPLEQWYVSDNNWVHSYGGSTQDEALAEFANVRGHRLWNEEGL